MKIVTSPADVRACCLDARRRGKRIGFVPTMGQLHEGHLSLVREARQRSGFVVVSIFVNPAQFGPSEDFDRYPRDVPRDRALCEGEGVDLLFCPAVGDMYPPGSSIHVDETVLSGGLCGRSRPGHFRGVVTIVAKLFNIVGPDVAIFGRKDAQQLRIIEQLVRDLDFPIDIVGAPIVREADGLAMSSRNVCLAPPQRRWAPAIQAALQAALSRYRAGEKDAATLAGLVRERLQTGPDVVLDYVDLVSWTALTPIAEACDGALLAVALQLGQTRLIDNVRFGESVRP